MQTPDLNLLSQPIEHLIREHLESCRKMSHAAIERALSEPAVQRAQASLRPRVRQAQSCTTSRRPAAEIEQLAEQLYHVIQAQPGATMSVLAPALGATARVLKRPMARLRQQERIRSVGSRHLTRYYPLVAASPG